MRFQQKQTAVGVNAAYIYHQLPIKEDVSAQNLEDQAEHTARGKTFFAVYITLYKPCSLNFNLGFLKFSFPVV